MKPQPPNGRRTQRSSAGEATRAACTLRPCANARPKRFVPTPWPSAIDGIGHMPRFPAIGELHGLGSHGATYSVYASTTRSLVPLPGLPDMAKRDAQLLAENHTDSGNARRLVARHGPDLCYVSEWGWMVWDGARWKRDTTGEAHRRAKETARAMLREAAEENDSKRRDAAVKHALATESARGITNMLAMAASEPEIAAEPAAFDREHLLLNVANGTIDLTTGELREHRREDLITRLAPVEYDPDARSERWLRFLREVMKGRQQLEEFLQIAVGYSLTGETSEQVLFFLHGRGSNGKGAFIRTIEAMLGDYARTADFSAFLEQRGERIPEALADLTGARFVPASEPPRDRRFAEGMVKNVTGQDTLSARFLRKDRFTFRPRFKLWLSANEKPPIHGTDEGIWRRILLIPFELQVTRDRIDDTLERDLQGAELPGILAWAVEGCQRWLEQKLPIPDEVRLATAAYREEMDTIGGFLAECCELDDHATESFVALHERFNGWASKGEQMTARRFSNVLSDRGFGVVRSGSNGSRRRVGLRLVALTPHGTDASDGLTANSGNSTRSALGSNRESAVSPSVRQLEALEVEHG